MKITRKNRLILDMLILARLKLEEMSENEIQENYGSDYYWELKKYLKDDAFYEITNKAEVTL